TGALCGSAPAGTDAGEKCSRSGCGALAIGRPEALVEVAPPCVRVRGSWRGGRREGITWGDTMTRQRITRPLVAMLAAWALAALGGCAQDGEKGTLPTPDG